MAERGVVLVMPTPGVSSTGPVAVWITAAGWARACRTRWGHAWLVTPNGVLSPEEARRIATRPHTGARRRSGWRRFIPAIAGTVKKDVRDLLRAVRFHGAALSGPWERYELPFVWQHHELFHRGGFAAARKFGCPLVLFVDAPAVWESERWGVRRPGWGRLLESLGERPQLRGADLVACVSEEVAAAVRAHGVPAERVVVTPCSVDLDQFHPRVPAGELRRELGLDGSFVVGWVGSFRRFHGIELALEAFAGVQREVPEAALLLVGDGLERERMEEMARSLGIRQAVFTGLVDYREMPRHLCAMDVCLVMDPARAGFHYSPLKLREYMACGRAVVAPPSGQLAELLRDGVDSIVVPPGDSVALEQAILDLHRDSGLRERLGAAARLSMEEQGSWDRHLERVVEALEHRGLAAEQGKAG